MFALAAWVMVAGTGFYATGDDEARFRSAVFGLAILGLVLVGTFAGKRPRDNRPSAINRDRPGPSDDPHGDIVLIFAGLIFCEVCRCEFTCDCQHPPFSDEAYREQAAAMRAQGWTVGSDGITAYCPTCSASVPANQSISGGTQ